ncbi:MAG: thiamine/thiamine pyrophosphate ABC transporter permease ThiP [Pseudooceanicola sp.]|nr:thiamine/thiamine pyrophosphate ABC transporter permease ThiP [Pseudooceanicola sp.]
MAVRAEPVALWPGLVAAVLVAATMLAALTAVALRAETQLGLAPQDWSAIRFTVVQAALSALFSVALAIPVARALARRSFAGRGVLITLLGAPFILPVIVAVLGLLAVFGRGGWLNAALGVFGLPPLGIYGLHGVVLAHVFFNLPLATRLILQGWQEIPAERFRLAAQLAASSRDVHRLLERPMLLRTAPGVLALVFAICLTSFAVALTLGGGPKATTIELAIYQAFRFDFDLGRATLLSLVQIALTLGAATLALGVSGQAGFGAGLGRVVQRWDAQGAVRKALDAALILLAALFLLTPLAAITASGLQGLAHLPSSVSKACFVSAVVACLSTLVLLALALPIAFAAAKVPLVEHVGLLGLAVSPLVLGAGLFLVINPIASPAGLALPVTALVNALMALPFALRILIPKAREEVRLHARLAATLNMGAGQFFRLILLPRLRPQIGFAAGLAAALSMGDLGVIALFADPETATLPLQIYRLMAAYRMEAAAGAALLLLVMSVGAFWLCDKGGRLAAP